MHIERQKRKGATYFYMAENIRKKNGWEKIRVYIGKDLSSSKLRKTADNRKHEFAKKVDEAKRLADPLFSLVSAEQSEKIRKIKILHQKNRSKMPKMQYENYYEHFVTEFTYDTNAIEGSTVTLQETALILFDKVVPKDRTLREINEVQNHKDALDFMLRHKVDINKNFVLKMHKLLMHNILWKYAGTFRDVQVYVRGAEFTPPLPRDVEKEFKRLMLWYRANKRKYHPVVVAAYFHHVFESIHPCRDGNGRIGRLLLNFILRKNALPMVNIKYREKGKYYEALEAGNKGNLKPLTDIIIKYLERSEDSI